MVVDSFVDVNRPVENKEDEGNIKEEEKDKIMFQTAGWNLKGELVTAQKNLENQLKLKQQPYNDDQ